MTDQTRHSGHDKNWPKDEFGRDEVAQYWWWIIIPVTALLAVMLVPVVSWLKGKSADEVIVYCAQDQRRKPASE